MAIRLDPENLDAWDCKVITLGELGKAAEQESAWDTHFKLRQKYGPEGSSDSREKPGPSSGGQKEGNFSHLLSNSDAGIVLIYIDGERHFGLVSFESREIAVAEGSHSVLITDEFDRVLREYDFSAP